MTELWVSTILLNSVYILGLGEGIQMLPDGGPAALKRFLSIFNDLIFDSRVDRGIPSLEAAPDGPYTRPPLSRKAASMISFSLAAGFRASSSWVFGSFARRCHGSPLSPATKFPVSATVLLPSR